MGGPCGRRLLYIYCQYKKREQKQSRDAGKGSWAIHKRRRNILGEEGGLKFQCCKILEGRGVSKLAKKFVTSYMDGPSTPKHFHPSGIPTKNQLLMCPPPSPSVFHLPCMNDIESSGM